MMCWDFFSFPFRLWPPAVGDNSTDMEDDARWTLMATDWNPLWRDKERGGCQLYCMYSVPVHVTPSLGCARVGIDLCFELFAYSPASGQLWSGHHGAEASEQLYSKKLKAIIISAFRRRRGETFPTRNVVYFGHWTLYESPAIPSQRSTPTLSPRVCWAQGLCTRPPQQSSERAIFASTWLPSWWEPVGVTAAPWRNSLFQAVRTL